MGLVDYDSSGSEDESPAPAPAAAPSHGAKSSTAKKPFQKLLDGGKIRVSLPTPGATDATPADADHTPDQLPPAKRVRLGAGSVSKFGGFNALLPPPKNRVAAVSSSRTSAAAGASSLARKPGVSLKTGAAPAWTRDGVADDDTLSSSKQPEIPHGMTPAEDVKFVGKPLMFKPLSVSRKQAKKTGVSSSSTKPAPQSGVVPPRPDISAAPAPAPEPAPAPTPAPAPQKVSLFSFAAAEQPAPSTDDSTPYTPLFATASTMYAATPAEAPAAGGDGTEGLSGAAGGAEDDLATLADTMNLSAAARRALFGRSRDAAAFSSAKVVNFNMDREYAHNEELRARGEEQVHNPLRAIQPGKHNLRQLVSQVQNQREALEESFAAGKNKRKEAGGRYGW